MAEAPEVVVHEQGTCGKCWACMKNTPFMTLMRFFGAGSGCVVIIMGIISFVTLSVLSPTVLINSFYLIIFGALIIFAELRWLRFLKGFKFLTTYLGLGLFYVFVGGLALNSSLFEIVVAIIFIFIGIVYICFSLTRKKMFDVPLEGEAVALPAGAQNVVDQVKTAQKVAATAQKVQQFVGPSEPASQAAAV